MKNYLWRIKYFLFSCLVRKTLGARALVIAGNTVLLVKHSYTPGWYTIGGSIERGETPIEALQRELLEEVGVSCLTLPKLINVYHSKHAKRDDYVMFYLVNDFKKIPVNSGEILEEKWFELQNLPSDISPATKRRIEEYLGLRRLEEQW